MTSWLSSLEKSTPLIEAFGVESPNLHGAEIQDIRVTSDKSELALRLNLAEYPANPPREWLAVNNVVQIQISLTSLSKLSLEGISRGMFVDVVLERSDEGVRLAIDSESIRLEAEAKSAVLTSLTSYIDQRRLPLTPS